MSRVTSVEPEPWVLKPGGWVESEYDVPTNAWYFSANRQASMPFSVLLEIALQPCGWLAAYLGSALRSDTDLKFRNLEGTATLHQEILPDMGTLIMRCRLTKVSDLGNTIIQNFDMEILTRDRQMIYEGNTAFGFFTAVALSNQVGIRDAKERAYELTPEEHARSIQMKLGDLPGSYQISSDVNPLPSLRMIDEITHLVEDGGPFGKGFVRGIKRVDPTEWFFKAHFYQDPVCPGSLGLESFIQLLKYFAVHRWGEKVANADFEPILVGSPHSWVYRGQVIPTNQLVEVDAHISDIDDENFVIKAGGFLKVDDLYIYEMIDFAIRVLP